MVYSFIKQDKTLNLTENNCEAIFNDETLPIEGLSIGAVLDWLGATQEDIFELEYFEDDCETCPPKPRGKKKLVPFFEGHFYLFTKKGVVVKTSIQPDFETGSFDEMLVTGIVDDSYIVSLIVCPNCETYQIEVERCEM